MYVNRSTITTQQGVEFAFENSHQNMGLIMLIVAGARIALTQREAEAVANSLRLYAEALSSPAYDY